MKIDVQTTSAQSAQALPSLLSAADPYPVEVCNGSSESDIVLLCEHAGQAIPQALDGLGVSKYEIDRHIGWDIGAEALAREIADRLNAPLIIQRYSRLVMDCNRPPGADGSIPAISDGTVIPRNQNLSNEDQCQRRKAIFDPMEEALRATFNANPRKAAFSIHSYTSQFQGHKRPWDAGFLSRRDLGAAQHILDRVAQAAPALTLAVNEPYQIDDASDWFIPKHAEARGLRHCLIEVANDHLRDTAGITRWADLLTPAIASCLEGPQ